MAKKQVKTSNKVVRNEKGQIVSGTPNPYGRPKNSLAFKTKWYNFIDKVAKQKNLTPQEIDEQLFTVGLKKAKEGDYNFYRDLHDRLYGKPEQTNVIEGQIDYQEIKTTDILDKVKGLLNAKGRKTRSSHSSTPAVSRKERD